MPTSQSESAELPLNADDATAVANDAVTNELPPQPQLSEAEVMSVISLKQMGVDVPSFLNQFSRSLVFDCELLRVTPRAWVTPTLVLLNLAMFGLVIAQTGRWEATVGDYIQWGANNGERTASGEPWRLLTGIFLHAGIIHLLLNMSMLWTCGRAVERMLGNGSFLIVYLFSGVCGSLASVVWNPTKTSIGASGAVFGILAAHLGLLIRRRRDFPHEVVQQHRTSLVTFFIANAGIGWMVPAIDLAGHIGGLVAGLVFGLLFKPVFLLPPTSWRRSRLVLQALFALSVSVGGAMLLPRPNADASHWSNLFPKKSAAQLEEDRRMMISLIESGDRWMQLGGISSDNPQLRVLVESNRISAMRSYINAHDLAVQLSIAKPDDPQAQRDLAELSNKFGDAFRKLGRIYDAPKSRELADLFHKLGDLLLKFGRSDDAIPLFQDGLKLRLDLATDNPNDSQSQFQVFDSRGRLGQAFAHAGKFDQAREQFVQGLSALDGLMAQTPSDESFREYRLWLESQRDYAANAPLAVGDWDSMLKVDAKLLPQLLILRARHFLKMNELAGAVQAADKLRELAPADKNDLYRIASIYSRCADVINKGKSEPTDTEKSECRKLQDVALVYLKKTIDAGFDKFDDLRQDREFKGLHGLPEFEGLFPIKRE